MMEFNLKFDLNYCNYVWLHFFVENKFIGVNKEILMKKNGILVL